MPLPDWLPALVPQESSMEWSDYEAILFNYFANDFISNHPRYKGIPVRLPPGTDINGRNHKFWHVISRGKGLEVFRNIKPGRCERILWASALINHAHTTDVVCWEQPVDGQMRAIITLHDFTYQVVLGLGGTQPTLITAYHREHSHERRQLYRQWQAAIKEQERRAGND